MMVLGFCDFVDIADNRKMIDSDDSHEKIVKIIKYSNGNYKSVHKRVFTAMQREPLYDVFLCEDYFQTGYRIWCNLTIKSQREGEVQTLFRIGRSK